MGKLTVNTIEDNGNNTIITADGLGDVTLRANTIDAVTGTSSLTLGGTNATSITLGSGASFSNVSGQNYPAFAAYNNTEQTGISDWTNTKVQYNTEVLDSDNCYDASTNYRFTPNVAGKYFAYHRVGYGRSDSNVIYGGIVYLFKNGSSIAYNQLSPNSSSPDNYFKQDVSAIIDMNGTTDYLEAYVRIGVNSGTISVYAGITENMFMAYRIGA